METVEPAANRTSSRNDFDSETKFLRIALAAAGELPPNSPDAALPAIYEAYARKRATAVTRREKGREVRDAAMMEHARIQGLHRRARHFGIDPQGLDEESILRQLEEREREEESRREAIGRAKLRERLFAQAGCPKLHTENLQKVYGDEWLRKCNLIIEQTGYAKGYFVGLLGPRGTGKTEMAVRIIHACCGQLFVCRYIKAKNLFADFNRVYQPVERGRASITERQILEYWRKPVLLVIDELHQRKESDAEEHTLVNLLDHRYDDNTCTLLIANQTKEQFGESLGDSLVSRLHEKGEAIECDWPSYRRPGGWRQRPGSQLRQPSVQ
jgi:DNA replication protein DnaC